jgi:hypothetical protein
VNVICALSNCCVYAHQNLLIKSLLTPWIKAETIIDNLFLRAPAKECNSSKFTMYPYPLKLKSNWSVQIKLDFQVYLIQKLKFQNVGDFFFFFWYCTSTNWRLIRMGHIYEAWYRGDARGAETRGNILPVRRHNTVTYLYLILLAVFFQIVETTKHTFHMILESVGK